jgi:hypothetical protein
MHEIYSNSYLSIAASKTKGPDEGLFSASSQQTIEQFLFSPDRQEQSVMRVRRDIPHLNSIESFPLLKRGWVFQERVFVPTSSALWPPRASMGVYGDGRLRVW